MRRSTRRRDYSSSSSRTSSTETDYHLRRRRKRRGRKIRRPLVFKLGDKVEFKKSGGRRRRAKWVLAEVCDVHRAGMYGELTYTVWLFESGRMVNYVRSDELRFRYRQDLERRQREEEIARCQEDLRLINIKLARQQREREFSRGRVINTYMGGRGRSQHAARAWRPQPRAHSVDGNMHISARPVREERATSVPPGNQSWPVFLAEFAKGLEKCEYNVDEHQMNEFDNEAINYGREIRHNHGIYVDENEHDPLIGDDYYRSVGDVNYAGADTGNHLEFIKNDLQRTLALSGDDRFGTNNNLVNVKENNKINGSGINLNFHFPTCRGQQVGGI